RKNYFYPDSAKNYQVTQYDRPSTRNGWVEFEFGTGTDSAPGLSRVRITRAHLEEDVGKNNHFERHSGVDFNRAGVPLLEIVSEPDLTSSDMAYAYLRALTDILVRGGVSDCDLEKGMVRCDVNISVRPKGETRLGAKIELKNLNSFSAVRRAIEFEVARQKDAVARGETLRQETRRWDDDAGITEPMRSKEDAHDYRYFPEPDLMPFRPTEAWLAEVRARVPELPLARKQRLMREFGLPAADAAVLSDHLDLGRFFEAAAPGVKNPKAIANWVINNLPAQLAARGIALEALPFGPDALRELVALVDSGAISSRIAQDVFVEMMAGGGRPEAIVAAKGWAQMSDAGAIETLADQVIASHPGPAADYRSGKAAALNFLKGQLMKLSKGKANPAMAGEVLERKLGSVAKSDANR
ncbi:MAG: Asp-tRNA(Asn)/Glu-tRNA(Gln) amidotransferase subunit GatB, partial [Verrucomicrobiae bacterium]|nr:Asp-tRNA(Asn)/Glu-tRNA(Gln) amidotransferase subunit GatB [Verrucomicrobiae bacterium]